MMVGSETINACCLLNLRIFISAFLKYAQYREIRYKIWTGWGRSAYDAASVRELLDDLGMNAHIRSRSDEAHDLKHDSQAKARRWVVERDHSWLNRYRAILTGWCRKPENYFDCFHLACGLIAYQQAGLFG